MESKAGRSQERVTRATESSSKGKFNAVSVPNAPAMQEISQQYGEPLDTFFYTHRNLSYEHDAKGRVVYNFIKQDHDFNGVYFDKRNNKYRAIINHNNVQMDLGRFELASDAAKTYDDFAILMNRKRLEENGCIRHKLNFRYKHEYISARIKEIQLRGME